MGSLDVSIENLFTQYQLSLEAANRSQKTITWYLPILHRFFNFLKKQGHTTDINKIGREEVRAYTKYLQEAERWANRPKNGKDLGNMSPYSIQGHVRAIKTFFSWLANDGIIERNPLAKFPLPKVPQYIIKTLTPEQINQLLSAIDKTTPLGFKYYCVILLLVDTGMRISELVSIKISDLDIQQGYITILGKGQKQRIVPISIKTRKELINYMERFR